MNILKKIYSYIKFRTLIIPIIGNFEHGKNLKLSRKTEVICRDGKIVVGDNVTIFEYGKISAVENGSIVLKNNIFLNRNCLIFCHKKIIIEDGCIFGPNVCIYDHDHKFSRGSISPNEYSCREVIIGEGCWIGAGAIILKGSHIGKNSIIGAGCIIAQDIPDNSIVRRGKDTVSIEEIM